MIDVHHTYRAFIPYIYMYYYCINNIITKSYAAVEMRNKRIPGDN